MMDGLEIEEKASLRALAGELYHRSTDQIFKSWHEDAKQAADRLDSGISLISTGDYNQGDLTTLSFPKKALTIIAGKTGGGKTTEMLNLSVSLSMKGHKGLFITLEEPEFSLAAKSMSIFDCYKQGKGDAQTANKFRYHLKTGKYKDWNNFKPYKKDIMRNLMIVDANKHSKSPDAAMPSSLYDPRCLSAFAEFYGDKLDFIMVDYVQLMSSGEYQQAAYVNIKNVMQSIRYMTGQHSCAIIMGAQLNREASKLDISEWQPEHLREAADIEQGANMILAVGRIPSPGGVVSMGMRLLKNRDGNPFQSGVFDISYPHQFINPEPLERIPEYVAK
jgi:replicative DNA helicase